MNVCDAIIVLRYHNPSPIGFHRPSYIPACCWDEVLLSSPENRSCLRGSRLICMISWPPWTTGKNISQATGANVADLTDTRAPIVTYWKNTGIICNSMICSVSWWLPPFTMVWIERFPQSALSISPIDVRASIYRFEFDFHSPATRIPTANPLAGASAPYRQLFCSSCFDRALSYTNPRKLVPLDFFGVA